MSDREFIHALQVIKRGATDERNFVKKAVNWALRSIGKKNTRLNNAAIKTAKELRRSDSKAAQWIAADAIRELESDAVQKRLRKQSDNRAKDRRKGGRPVTAPPFHF